MKNDTHTHMKDPPSLEEQIRTLRAAGWSAFESAVEQVKGMKPLAALEFWKRCQELEANLQERLDKTSGDGQGVDKVIEVRFAEWPSAGTG